MYSWALYLSATTISTVGFGDIVIANEREAWVMVAVLGAACALQGSLIATLGSVTCATLPDRPDETTTWEVCPTGTSSADCTAQQAACEYSVQRQPMFEYLKDDATSSSTAP